MTNVAVGLAFFHCCFGSEDTSLREHLPNKCRGERVFQQHDAAALLVPRDEVGVESASVAAISVHILS